MITGGFSTRGWVKTMETHVVHIKIAGIYGCSSPFTHCIYSYWSIATSTYDHLCTCLQEAKSIIFCSPRIPRNWDRPDPATDVTDAILGGTGTGPWRGSAEKRQKLWVLTTKNHQKCGFWQPKYRFHRPFTVGFTGKNAGWRIKRCSSNNREIRIECFSNKKVSAIKMLGLSQNVYREAIFEWNQSNHPTKDPNFCWSKMPFFATFCFKAKC